MLLDKVTSPDTFTWIREASRISILSTKNVIWTLRGRGIGAFDVSRSKILKSSIQSTQQYTNSSIFVSVFIF